MSYIAEMPSHQEFADSLQDVAHAVSSGELEGSQKRKRDDSIDGLVADGVPRPSSKQRLNVDDQDSGYSMAEQQSGIERLQQYNNMNRSDIPNGDEHADASSTAAAALSHFPIMSVPQATEVSFQQSSDGDRNQNDFSMDDGQTGQDPFMMQDNDSQSPVSGGRSGSKPAVGSHEWHKVRKDNHKEVERRRRETINEGINELAKIVPGCEKNKGSILQRAVSFITQLKDNEAQNIEKWTLEKLLTEQAIAELSASNDKLKTECERAWREAESWKKMCQSSEAEPKREEPVLDAS